VRCCAKKRKEKEKEREPTGLASATGFLTGADSQDGRRHVRSCGGEREKARVRMTLGFGKQQRDTIFVPAISVLSRSI
jgi:hypothetical protein